MTSLTRLLTGGILVALLVGCVSPPEPGSLEYIKAKAARQQAEMAAQKACAAALAKSKCRRSMRCEVRIPVGDGWLICRH